MQIKTKVIQTPKGRLLVVDTPEGASDVLYPKIGLVDLARKNGVVVFS